MAIQVKTKEELAQELASKNELLAVNKDKLKTLSEKLGIEPTYAAIDTELKSLEEEEKNLDDTINSLLAKIEEVEKDYASDSEETDFNAEVPEKTTHVDDFE